MNIKNHTPLVALTLLGLALTGCSKHSPDTSSTSRTDSVTNATSSSRPVSTNKFREVHTEVIRNLYKAATTDAKSAAEMSTITNIIVKTGAIYKMAEAGELGPEASFQIVIGSNSDQRLYILTWKEAKWLVTPTNQ